MLDSWLGNGHQYWKHSNKMWQIYKQVLTRAYSTIGISIVSSLGQHYSKRFMFTSVELIWSFWNSIWFTHWKGITTNMHYAILTDTTYIVSVTILHRYMSLLYVYFLVSNKMFSHYIPTSNNISTNHGGFRVYMTNTWDVDCVVCSNSSMLLVLCHWHAIMLVCLTNGDSCIPTSASFINVQMEIRTT